MALNRYQIIANNTKDKDQNGLKSFARSTLIGLLLNALTSPSPELYEI